MENKCWFCNTNEASQDMEYPVALKKHDNRKDAKTVDINRCEECAQKHKKGDILSFLMYLIEIILVAIAYFVFHADLIYIAVVYVILMRPLTSLSKKIRDSIASPNKSVCHVADNDEVKELLEEGYIESRRF